MAATTDLAVTAMHGDVPAYGLWLVAAVNAGILTLFAFSFFKPKTARDWRSLGAFSAFIVALFVEMYGFPLTLYLLAGWAGSSYPALDPLSHDAGHLWPALVTGLMLPVLLVMYWRLAMREEREVEAEFGERYRAYASDVPAFIPRLSRTAGEVA
jgi:protein-S-isoprenylcysteine O-methyltransferase Ste14